MLSKYISASVPLPAWNQNPVYVPVGNSVKSTVAGSHCPVAVEPVYVAIDLAGPTTSALELPCRRSTFTSVSDVAVVA